MLNRQSNIQQITASTRQTANMHQMMRIKMIEAPCMELRTMLADAVQLNPLLEINEDNSLFASNEDSVGIIEGVEKTSVRERDASELTFASRSKNSSTIPFSIDNLRDFAANLEESSDFQLDVRLQTCALAHTPSEQAILDSIIDSLDERGLFVGNTSAIAARCNCAEDAVVSMLESMKLYLHNGIGAKDLIEAVCLRLPNSEDAVLASNILSSNLADIKAGRVQKIAKEQGVSKNTVIRTLKALSEIPSPPVYVEAAERAVYVYPDIIVELDEGQLVLNVIGGESCPTKISSYADLINTKGLSKKDSDFISKHAYEAHNYINALEARNTLMHNFALLLGAQEHDYLVGKSQSPEPLSMQAVSDQLGVNISTISRLCKDKYIRTIQGTIPLDSFFLKNYSTVSTSEGEAIIKKDDLAQLIEEEIQGEDSANPLSDAQIAERIAQKTGVQLARRTVAKYRTKAGIPNHSARRLQAR